MPTLTTTVAPFSGGAASVAAVPAQDTLTISGTWDVGDQFSIILTNTLSGVQTLIGAGNVSGIVPTFAFTFGNRVNVLAGATDYFSAVGTANVFNSLTAIGNSFVTMSDYFATQYNLVSAAPYQGYVAFFNRWDVQIWQTNADPLQWAQIQVLANIGTTAAKSVVSLGDLDVMFLSDTGLRSLRARETTLNAFVSDIGSPIDSLVQASLTASGNAGAASVGVVEPLSGRYWCYVNDTMYVLSYFPANKIVAWSTYACTYSLAGTQTAFTPTDMCVYNGQVFLRSGVNCFLYGGTNEATYDNAVATLKTTWLDLKTPGTRKKAKSIDVACSGSWQVLFGTDQLDENANPVLTTSQPTYQTGSNGVTGDGFHFQCQAVTTGSTAAKMSALMVHYTEGNEK